MKSFFVPFDFSARSANALVYALRLANDTGSSVLVFNALGLSRSILQAPVIGDEKARVIKAEEERENIKLQQKVAEIIAQHDIRIDETSIATKVSMYPEIIDSITKTAEAEHADLIVMGTHGATGLKKLFFGSVTSATISKSVIPVLAIPENVQYTRVEKVVYASDFEQLESELASIIPLAALTAAEIDTVYFDYGLGIQDGVEEVIEKQPYKRISLSVQKADITDTLLKQIKQYSSVKNAQWMVMFTRERSMWEKLFLSSKTEELATELKLPLLSFRKDLH